jgi:hypothetical protein
VLHVAEMVAVDGVGDELQCLDFELHGSAADFSTFA